MTEGKPPHLLHIFPTFAVGGSQIRFGQLVRLHGNRYSHTVIALDGVLAMASQLPQEAPVAYATAPAKGGSLVKNVRQALAIIRQINPDRLVTYNWGSMYWWLARKFRPSLPHVHIEDGFGPEERASQLRRRTIMRRLALADTATDLVLPSTTLLEIARKQWSLPARRLHYIPNGINLSRFAVNADTRRGKSGLVIGTVATLRREKNLGRLIRLFSQAATARPDLDLSLLIVGAGSEADALRAQAQQSPSSSRIRFTGGASHPEEFLATMDIFALTSDTEQMPLSVLEAMASGLPVVSFDVGDVAQMVGAKNRDFASIARHDDETFVRHLLDLGENGSLRQELGAGNLATVRTRFDEAEMAKAYAALFG
jgi:glycosyltransferase involved in cell wall biosynthesis